VERQATMDTSLHAAPLQGMQSMRPVTATLLLLLLDVHAGSSTSQSCATLGCSTHKVSDGRPCQCNFHCSAHHDCCTDYAAACPNASDPMVSPHGGANGGENGTAKVTKSTKAASTKTAHEPNTKHSAGKQSGSTHTASSSGGKGAGSKGGADGVATAVTPGGNSTIATGGGGTHSSSKGGGATKDKGEHQEHSKEKTEHPEHGEHHSSNHSPGAKHSSTTSLIVVLLACATGITVPITISIILILRARGVCCVSSSFQRIDKPPAQPAAGGAELESQPASAATQETGCAPAAL